MTPMFHSGKSKDNPSLDHGSVGQSKQKKIQSETAYSSKSSSHVVDS